MKPSSKKLNNSHRFSDLPHLFLLLIASSTVILLICIFLFLLIFGIQTFSEIKIGDFLFGQVWNPSSYKQPSWGILSLVSGTLIISFLSLLFSLPIGILVAIYLSEIAPLKVREIFKPLIEMISSIPSVVLGLLGLIFLSPIIAKVFNLSNGLNALNASILVSIVSLPTIISICEDALSEVPRQFRDASLALGATKFTTIKKVVIPAAKSGIVAGGMLGLGRIIGETMIVLMVAGNSLAFPKSFLDPVRPITANIAIEIKEVVTGSLHWHSLFALGLVLFVITFLINLVVDLFIYKKDMR